MPAEFASTSVPFSRIFFVTLAVFGFHSTEPSVWDAPPAFLSVVIPLMPVAASMGIDVLPFAVASAIRYRPGVTSALMLVLAAPLASVTAFESPVTPASLDRAVIRSRRLPANGLAPLSSMFETTQAIGFVAS